MDLETNDAESVRLRIRFSERFSQVSSRYPLRVTETFGGDLARAMAATDEEVRAAVREWEIGRGIEPRDWELIGKKEGQGETDVGDEMSR